jgi:hypothetical protein
MLKVNGSDIMKELGIKPGPKIGWVLEVILGEVLSDPLKNNKEYLMDKIKEIGGLGEDKLRAVAEKAKKDREKIEIKKDEMTKKKYWVL